MSYERVIAIAEGLRTYSAMEALPTVRTAQIDQQQ